MRKKKKSLTLLLSGIIVVAVVLGGALLVEDAASTTGGVSNAAPPQAGSLQAADTSITLSTSVPSPITQGAPLTLTATVIPEDANGTVQFKDGSADIGNAVTVSDGTAIQTTSTLTVGTHQLTAVFTPANPARYGRSTSPAVPFEISGATGTTTELTTSAASPVTQGTSVTLTATVTPADAAGTVQFRDGSTTIGDAVAVSNGTATQTTSTLTVGTHQLTAVFTPANPTLYGPSTSPSVPFEISGATATTTALTAMGASTPVVQGTSVTLTATVTPSNAAGTVQFRDGDTNIGDAVIVSNGTATQNTTTLAVGSHQLTAVFTPTNTVLFNSSMSPAETLVVAGPTTTMTTLTTSPESTVIENTAVELTATIAPSAAAGTVQFMDGGNDIGGAVTVSNGIATQTTSTLTVGTHQLTAVFIPANSTLYSTSTSPAVSFEVTEDPLLAAALEVVPQENDTPEPPSTDNLGTQQSLSAPQHGRNGPVPGRDQSAGRAPMSVVSDRSTRSVPISSPWCFPLCPTH